MAFLLHFKDDGKKTYKTTVVFFLCILFQQIYCVIFSYIPFTCPLTSTCFLSKNMRILASCPELQAVRFGFVILGENGKKVADP
jgi:nucleoside recognition membrane protein YjiH